MASTWCCRSPRVPTTRIRSSTVRCIRMPQEWIELVGDFENQFWFVGSQERTFYFLTDLKAPTKRVVAMELDQPGRSDAA